MVLQILIQLMIFVVSLVVLSKASDVVVNSSIKLARMFKISTFVVGFLLISIATSLPEMMVSLRSVLIGEVGISVGNLLGSNIANVALILGIVAVFVPIIIKKDDLHDLSTILFMTSFFPLILIQAPKGSRFVGFGLLFSFVFFALSLVRKRKELIRNAHHLTDKKLIPHRVKMNYKPILFFATGIFFLLFSAKYVVSSAVFMANYFSIAQSLIGATIVAIGTSLPELAVTLRAVKEKKFSLGLGNIIGSAMTNIGLILGLVLVLNPFTVDFKIFSNLIVFLLLSNILFWYFIMNEKIDRKEGIAFIIFYQVFLIVSFVVGI